ANRIDTREKLLRKSFVHDRDARFQFVLALGEIAATQGDSHGFKETGTDRHRDACRKPARTDGRLALEINAAGIVVECQGKVARQSRRPNARYGAYAFQNLVMKSAAFGFLVALQPDVEGNRDRGLGIESGSHLLRGLHLATDHSRAEARHQGKRALGDDERVAQWRTAKPTEFRVVL